MGPVALQEDVLLPEPREAVLGRLPVGLPRGPVLDQVDPDKHPPAPDVADARVLVGQPQGALLEQAANPDGVPHEALPLDHVEDGAGDRAADRVAAVRVEVLDARRPERLGNLRRRHDGGDGMAVAHRLADGDNVGREAVGVRLEGPHVRPRPPEAHLNLVGDDDAPGRPHRPVHRGQVAVGIDDLAAARLEALGEKGGRPAPPLPGDPLADLLDLAGVDEAHVLAGMVAVPVDAPVDVGHGRHVGGRRPPAAPRLVELVRRDLDEADEVAVVGVVEGDDVAPAGVLAGQPDGEVVGLGARVDEVGDGKVAGERRAQALGVVDQVVVEEPEPSFGLFFCVLQSWALRYFWFFTNKKLFVCIFYQVNLTGSGHFKIGVV